MIEQILNGKPIAEQLVDTLSALAFFPGYTCCDFKESPDEMANLVDIPMRYAWASGVQTETVESYNQTVALERNRFELVQCLITLFSQHMFCSNEEIEASQYHNKLLDYFTSKVRPQSKVLLASLFNVALGYDPVGWGIPYNHVVSVDIKELLMNSAIHLLTILMNYNATPVRQPAHFQQVNENTVEQENEESKKELPTNVFIGILNSYTKEDAHFLFKGFLRILTNPIESSHTYLPNSTKHVGCHQELLILFFQMILVSRVFLMYILKLDDFVNIIYPILHFIHEARKDEAQNVIVQVGTSILLYLSGERSFSIALNKTFDKYIFIAIPKFKGNYADYLILTLFNTFADSHEKTWSLRECYLTIISNISPYVKGICLISAQKLLKLFVSLSRENYIYRDENNFRHMFFLLEAFNNIIQYQYEGNIYLVYAIIANKDHFFKLFKMIREKSQLLEQSKEDETIELPSLNMDTTTVSQEKGFKPSKEWLKRWVTKVPVLTIIRFLQGILPQIETIINGDTQDEDIIVNFLRKTTLVGLLPPPHPLIIRHFNTSRQGHAWLTRSIWITIFFRTTNPDKLFSDSHPRLFKIKA